jgi:hypothetical protein
MGEDGIPADLADELDYPVGTVISLHDLGDGVTLEAVFVPRDLPNADHDRQPAQRRDGDRGRDQG